MALVVVLVVGLPQHFHCRPPMSAVDVDLRHASHLLAGFWFSARAAPVASVVTMNWARPSWLVFALRGRKELRWLSGQPVESGQ